MKILIADVLLRNSNSDWKEGYELCYAFRNLGHECDVYGPNGKLSELEIPDKKPKYIVKSKPIHKILENIEIKKVDLFSIDVEGGELDVLTTFNWNIPVYIVLIEMAKHDLEKDENCRKFLISKNFEFEGEIGCNEVWINRNYKK